MFALRVYVRRRMSKMVDVQGRQSDAGVVADLAAEA
jgi:hypothetical protein